MGNSESSDVEGETADVETPEANGDGAADVSVDESEVEAELEELKEDEQ